MNFPLNLWDVNLLVAILSIVLLSSSEFISISRGKLSILIDKKKMRRTAYAVSVTFLILIGIRVVATILGV